METSKALTSHISHLTWVGQCWWCMLAILILRTLNLISYPALDDYEIQCRCRCCCYCRHCPLSAVFGRSTTAFFYPLNKISCWVGHLSSRSWRSRPIIELYRSDWAAAWESKLRRKRKRRVDWVECGSVLCQHLAAVCFFLVSFALYQSAQALSDLEAPMHVWPAYSTSRRSAVTTEISILFLYFI